MRERIQLDEAAVGDVPLDHANVGPRGTLFATKPGDPRSRAGEGAGEGPELSYRAALEPILHRFVKAVRPLGSHEALDRDGVRSINLEREPILIACAIDEIVSLLRKATRIEQEDARRPREVFGGPRRFMKDDHVLDPETAGDPEIVPVPTKRLVQDVIRRSFLHGCGGHFGRIERIGTKDQSRRHRARSRRFIHCFISAPASSIDLRFDVRRCTIATGLPVC
jgi:hypothetical protein